MSSADPDSPVDLAREPRFMLGGIEVRPPSREVIAPGGPHVLEPRVMQVLVALARRRAEVVSREDLIGACWGGRTVGGNAIDRCIGAIRKLSRSHGGYTVTTVARVGYRLEETASGSDRHVAGVPPPLPNRPSIAVLPFAYLSGDPEQEAFADGMVEEIARALSRFKSIFVIGGASGLAFKGKAATPQEVGRTLGVRYVLEGSVRKAADRIRIAVKLIDASDGAQIWADRFEDGVGDVFALQDKVALSAAGIIEPAVHTRESRRAMLRPTYNIDSYDLWLRAMILTDTHGRAEVFEALALLKRAMTLDPRFAMAVSSAAWCHSFILICGWSDDPEAQRRQGLDLAQRALRLGGDDPDVLSNTAMALYQLGQGLRPSVAMMDRAIALNPGSSNCWYLSAVLRLFASEPEVAVEHILTSIRLDPLSPGVSARLLPLGGARFLQRRFEDAVAHLTEAGRVIETSAIYAVLAASCGHLGRISQAREALERYQTVSHIPVSEMSGMFRNADHRQLFLTGIALAQGRTILPAGS
jgi:TolB-like protein